MCKRNDGKVRKRGESKIRKFHTKKTVGQHLLLLSSVTKQTEKNSLFLLT